MLALTATADKSMRERLCKLLGFKGHKELIISPNKENICLSVISCDKTFPCFNWLVDIIKEKKAESPLMIIFCHTVSDIVLVLSTLLMKLGNNAYLKGSDPAPNRCILAVYYSATPESAKTRVTNSFSFSGNARAVIASTSLSMEIDFPHVRCDTFWTWTNTHRPFATSRESRKRLPECIQYSYVHGKASVTM